MISEESPDPDNQGPDHENDEEMSAWEELELDDDIRAMYEEERWNTPEMPPDFHDRVMKRIRNMPLSYPENYQAPEISEAEKALEKAEGILKEAFQNELDEDITQFWQDEAKRREGKGLPPDGNDDPRLER